MLPRENRIRRSADFSAVMRRGRRAGRPSLTVVYLAPEETAHATDESSPPRVGFTVGKAVGGAVVRHLVQRRLRHLMRERLHRLRPGSLLVIRAKPPAATYGYDMLATHLDGALDAATRPRRAARRHGAGASGTAAGGELAPS